MLKGFRLFAIGALVLSIGGLSFTNVRFAANSQTGQLPVVALVDIQTCPVCARVRAILPVLEQEFKGKVEFANLDVSDDKATAAARKEAQRLGIADFLSKHEESFPSLGVFSKSRKLVQELNGAKSKAEYVSAIKKALASK